MSKTIDVTGVGAAIVDVLSNIEDRFLDDNGLKKSAMTLIDEPTSDALYEKMPTTMECSGGSVANSIAGVASFGGKASFIGKVKNDQFGKIFSHDIRSVGVEFETPPTTEGPSTSSCLVAITPDAERTMQTYLGASTQLSFDDLDEEKIKASKILYLEGYVMDIEIGLEWLNRAADIAHANDTLVALNLSDPWFVDRHRDALLGFVKEKVDILLGNDGEATSLFKTTTLQDALNIIDSIVPVAAITKGAEGSIICKDGEQYEVKADAVTNVVDTTGAGDLYAAGVLYGLAQGKDPATCGRLGSLAAAEVISHIGARPQKPLAELAQEKLAA